MWDEVRGLIEVWGLGFEVWGLGSTLTVDDGLSEGKTTAQLSLKRFEVWGRRVGNDDSGYAV